MNAPGPKVLSLGRIVERTEFSISLSRRPLATTRNKKLIRGVGSSISIIYNFEAIPLPELEIVPKYLPSLRIFPGRYRDAITAWNIESAFDHSAIVPPLRFATFHGSNMWPGRGRTRDRDRPPAMFPTILDRPTSRGNGKHPFSVFAGFHLYI